MTNDYLLPLKISLRLRGEIRFISSLLLNVLSPPVFPVVLAWIHEMMFYIMFRLNFIFKQLFILNAINWRVTILMMAKIDGSTTTSPFLLCLSNPINLKFVLAKCVAYLARNFASRFETALPFSKFPALICFGFGCIH